LYVSQKIWVTGPKWPETKNVCAGEQQQQFARVLRQKDMVMNHVGPETKNDCAGEGQQQITALLQQYNFSGHYTCTMPSRSASALYLCQI
jgi:hypothetical protein